MNIKQLIGIAAMSAMATSSVWAMDGVPADMEAVAKNLPPKLMAVVRNEIQAHGLDGAVAACNEKAPALAKEASQANGMQIRRVSLKNRNPKAVPDAWEATVLQDFDRRAALGEAPANLEASTVEKQNGRTVFRYMKALPTQDMCLACHGKPAEMEPVVLQKIKTLYPMDKATGYSAGQIRGAITLKKDL
jgi:Protein of unknown function (DUF3365)